MSENACTSKTRVEIVCYICAKVCEGVKSLDVHIINHFGGKKYATHERQTTRQNVPQQMVLLKRSVEKSQNQDKIQDLNDQNEKNVDGAFVCDVCSKTFSQQSRLNRHKIVHNNKNNDAKKHKCDRCPRKFFTIEDLTNHVEKKHEKRFICKICKINFSQSSSLFRHDKTIHRNVRSHMCDQCPMVFSQRQHLRHHTEKKHTNPQARVNPQLKARDGGPVATYPCAGCGKMFKRAHKLCKSHHHTSKSLFQCDRDCGFVTGFIHQLKLHRANEMCRTYQAFKNKTVKCDLCESKFTTEKYMRKHRLYHSVEKRHPCGNCGKRFMDTCGLKKHMLKRYCFTEESNEEILPEVNS